MAPRPKKRWSELSSGQRTAILGAGTVQLALHLAALVDLRRRPAAEISGSKRVWVALSFVNFIGPLAYFAFGRRSRS
ncbi:PLD nuclease N-terminal domain-containing protein [Solirubrobacter soli]|uniref:PLD nuclease N-terminal domain-containing protein n=1 Tax=Solirubrobacter soli TaxID=363832 RepID=UPI000412B60A|nr:PLD nuclease N-terminal domain-containing protein [Solirubrobacter soli]